MKACIEQSNKGKIVVSKNEIAYLNYYFLNNGIIYYTDQYNNCSRYVRMEWNVCYNICLVSHIAHLSVPVHRIFFVHFQFHDIFYLCLDINQKSNR